MGGGKRLDRGGRLGNRAPARCCRGCRSLGQLTA